ncbi:MAG: polyphosphate:nucleotide phosphotransferase, family [Candidatus Eremiobacteraeota bacterium]|nr:polyphosphate:nucleotide phosphotransferase, family [Candidatus Eremiobacteraeota bacterium]
MNYRKKFFVEPGSKVRLNDVDPSFTGKHESADEAREAIAKDCDRLAHLQYRLYAENRRSLLVVLQAPDAAGKDGTVRHVFGSLNPQGATAHAFKVPTAEEAAHDFLWRAHKVTPARGSIAIFNRSYYEDVLVTRVHDLVPKDAIPKRFDRIAEFEKNLQQAGTQILKFYLHISADEQLRRFQQRLEDPNRQWKISESDYSERPYWNDYRKAYEDALEHTSTERSPWYVIPANHKWFRNLAVARIVTETLDEMDLQFPAPTVDIEEMRAKFHAAEGEPAGKA